MNTAPQRPEKLLFLGLSKDPDPGCCGHEVRFGKGLSLPSDSFAPEKSKREPGRNDKFCSLWGPGVPVSDPVSGHLWLLMISM